MYSILRSIAVIGFTGAVAYTGVTGAFFTDSESSVGNVFTAGTFTGIKIDSFGSLLNGSPVLGSNWTATDLSTHKFFNFTELMPGDNGVRHISLHNVSTSEDMWVCLNKGTVAQNALQNEIEVFAWRDLTPDHVYQPSTETAMTASPVKIKDMDKLAFADSTISGSAIPHLTNPASTQHMSVAWCAGSMSVNHTSGAITCSGSGMTTQGGSYVADMIVYAEQVSNNGSFTCAGM